MPCYNTAWVVILPNWQFAPLPHSGGGWGTRSGAGGRDSGRRASEERSEGGRANGAPRTGNEVPAEQGKRNEAGERGMRNADRCDPAAGSKHARKLAQASWRGGHRGPRGEERREHDPLAERRARTRAPLARAQRRDAKQRVALARPLLTSVARGRRRASAKRSRHPRPSASLRAYFRAGL